MLSKLYQKFFCTLPLNNTSDKIFKILYHPRLDYCRIDYKEFTVCEVEDLKNLLEVDKVEVPAFLRFTFTTRQNSHYLSEFPYQKLKHNQLYADIIIKSYRSEFLTEAEESKFLSYYHVDRIIINKYNWFLKIGIPQDIITSKNKENFYNKIKDSEVQKSIYSTPALAQINKHMKHVYTQRKGDKAEIINYIERFENYTNLELVNAYNSQKAIYGVHRQGLYLYALDIVFKKRFNKSPISNEENIIFGLTGRITYVSELKTFVRIDEN